MRYYLCTWLAFSLLMVYCVDVTNAFKVYWNVPTQQCKNHDKDFDITSLLKDYGIFVNAGDKFQGGNITIFYEAQLGLYPYISSSGEMVNGGIPQRGDILSHLSKAKADLNRIIPDKAFDGLGVIDWESWRPVWDFNWGGLKIYQEKSTEYAREMHQSRDNKSIEQLARLQWEINAESYMLETLFLAKKLRPNAHWCYYLFPDCYNYDGKTSKDFQCSKAIRKGNDKLDWLWKSSTALCPSIYLHSSHLDRYTLEERAWKDQGRLQEAARLLNANAQFYPYVNYYLDSKMVPEEDFRRMAAQAASVGSDGFVIWGPSSSVASSPLCNHLRTYIQDILGPAAERVAYNAQECRDAICNRRGWCTFPRDQGAVEWRRFLRDDGGGFVPGDVVCRCDEGFFGRYCEEEKLRNYLLFLELFWRSKNTPGLF